MDHTDVDVNQKTEGAFHNSPLRTLRANRFMGFGPFFVFAVNAACRGCKISEMLALSQK